MCASRASSAEVIAGLAAAAAGAGAGVRGSGSMYSASVHAFAFCLNTTSDCTCATRESRLREPVRRRDRSSEPRTFVAPNAQSKALIEKAAHSPQARERTARARFQLGATAQARPAKLSANTKVERELTRSCTLRKPIVSARLIASTTAGQSAF